MFISAENGDTVSFTISVTCVFFFLAMQSHLNIFEDCEGFTINRAIESPLQASVPENLFSSDQLKQSILLYCGRNHMALD